MFKISRHTNQEIGRHARVNSIKLLQNKLEINKISSAGCPASHPYAYNYYEDNDHCCPHDPAQDPYHNCEGEDSIYIGIECEHEPPCENYVPEQTCPENMPFNCQDTYMCCSVQPDAEGNCPDGAEGSNCNTHHPDTGIHTCADHPTAVRVEVEVDNHGQKSKMIKLKLNQILESNSRKNIL